jgi:hypothetical protein
MSRLIRYSQIVKELAFQSSMPYKLGSIIVSGGKIVGRGFNSGNRTSVNNRIFAGIHAEHSAILNYVNNKPQFRQQFRQKNRFLSFNSGYTKSCQKGGLQRKKEV